MKIALFQSISGGWTSTFEHGKRHLYEQDDYIRISAWVECEFPPLASEEISAQLDGLESEISAINQRIEEQRANKLMLLSKRRQALLAMLPPREVPILRAVPPSGVQSSIPCATHGCFLQAGHEGYHQIDITVGAHAVFP